MRLVVNNIDEIFLLLVLLMLFVMFFIDIMFFKVLVIIDVFFFIDILFSYKYLNGKRIEEDKCFFFYNCIDKCI